MIDATWYKKPNRDIHNRVTAGGIVIRKDASVIYVSLILEGRSKDFSLPKGGVKRGETLEAAARREIHEEAGLSDLTLIEYLGKRERLNITKSKWNTVHYFLFTTTQKHGLPLEQGKYHVSKWFPIDDLPKMLWPEQKRLIQKSKQRIMKLFLEDEQGKE